MAQREISSLTAHPEGDTRMPQSLSSILIHLIFGTKNREPFITPLIEKELHPYMASIFREFKSPSLTIGGTEDHVHILFALSRTIEVADLVEKIKTKSSKWIKTKRPEFDTFHWQRGYGAFSIGQSQVATVKRYIARQRIHHQRVTFQEEYRNFLKSYDIDFDERYVWD
jgi:putative transposase